MTGRRVPEWIGKTPNSVAPPHVVARIFDTHKGVCHITGIVIRVGDDWDVDHVRRLADGGENRETNMAPALRDAHQRKTVEETQRGRKADRVRRRHIGAKGNPKTAIAGRTKPEKAAPRFDRTPLPWRSLYEKLK